MLNWHDHCAAHTIEIVLFMVEYGFQVAKTRHCVIANDEMLLTEREGIRSSSKMTVKTSQNV